MFRTALFLLSGNAGTSLLSFLRNLLIASFISVEDYGIAATFAMVILLVEHASALGMDKQIVQSKKGGDPRYQAALQGFNVLRGLMAGAALFFAAGWIAEFLGIPEVTWAYQLLALIPISRGLVHFDVHRLKRQMRFGPFILTKLLPVLVSLFVIWPALLWLEDYRAMLAAVGVQYAMMLLVSHLVAERPYRLSLNGPFMVEALKFGWPLLINSLLLYIVFNGEKLIVGRALGMADLGTLAMGITLTLTPALVMAKSLQNFFLPQISALQDQAEAFQTMFLVITQCVFFCSALVLFLSIVLIPPFISLALGTEYASLIGLIIWLAILQTIRVLKTGPLVTAIAAGQTTNPMIANLMLVLVLPVAWWVAVQFGQIDLILFVVIAGEVLGFVVSILLVKYRLRLSLRRLLGPGMAILAVILGSTAYAMLTSETVPLWLRLAAPLLPLILSFRLMPELQVYIRKRDLVRATT
ncbi:MAG: oligosaccharide flippase family protein [Pseudomonadota bacterium]